jgi:outer membrane protein assembly factor BamB
LQFALTNNAVGLWSFALSVLGGLGALGALATIKVVPTSGLTPILSLFLLGTLWAPCAAWLGYGGKPGVWRIGGLAALILLALGFLFGVRVDGVDGSERIEFAWSGSARWDGLKNRDEMPTVPPAAIGETSPEDASQFLGPNRNGVFSLRMANWVGDALPRRVWQREVGPGWSSFATINNHAVTLEQVGSDECVSCYRFSDGALIWRHAMPGRFESIVAGDGPRATPAIAGNRVYAVTGTGRLVCLDIVSGKAAWSVDLLKRFNGANLEHGVCASPLIEGDRVIVCPTSESGPTLAAFNKDTGDLEWSEGTQRASYSSPVIWEVDNSRQILIHNCEGLAGHDAATGKVLWQFPWTNDCGANFAQPIPNAAGPGTVFVASGFGQGSALARVKRDGPNRWTAEPVWRSKALQMKFTSAVLVDGHLYGVDDGVLACVDADTGKLKWRDGNYQHGHAILVSDRIVVQAECGDIILVEPSPECLREVARLPALTRKTWAVPTVSAGHLLVRNDRQAICFELPRK